MAVAANSFPGMSDFHKELINRFFHPKSYFIFSFINELKTQEALLENPENVAVIGLVVDEIINASNKIEMLFNLTRIPGFDVFYHTLMEKVEYLRSTHLTTDQMMETVKELGVSLAVTFTSMMTRPDSRSELLSYAGLKETQPSISLHREASPVQENLSSAVKLGGKQISRMSGKETRFSGVENLLQEGQKTPDAPDPWDFFRDDVSKKLDEINVFLEKYKSQLHNRSLLRKVKMGFQELREWAMIQGNDGIETISMRTLNVLNLALRTFGFPLQNVLPDVEESVKALREVNRSGWAGENLDIVPVVLHRLQKLYKEVETIAQSENTQEATFETADLPEILPAENNAVEEESDFELDEEFESPEFQGFPVENQNKVKKGEVAASFPKENTNPETDLENASFSEEESPLNGEEESLTEETVPDISSKQEDVAEAISDEEIADEKKQEIPLVSENNFSISEMEKLYDEMFPQEDLTEKDDLTSEEMASRETQSPVADQEIEAQEEMAISDDSLGEIVDEPLLLSEVDEDEEPNVPAIEKEEDLSLPGEDDEDLLEVIDELSEELPDHSKATKEDGASEPPHKYFTNLLESEQDAPEEIPASDKNLMSQEEGFSESAQAPLFTRGGKDFVEEAEMYFQFAKRAFALLLENADNRRACEDVELACYSLKILSRKLGYDTVTRIVDKVETIFNKILSRELLLEKEKISRISDVILKMEELGEQNRLSDKDIFPWASEVLAMLNSFEENSLRKKMGGNHQDPEPDGSKDPLEFLMYDDAGKYFKQLLNE